MSRRKGRKGKKMPELDESEDSDDPGPAGDTATLQTLKPPSWFLDEMQKFTATIQASFTTRLDQVDATLEKLNNTMQLTSTKVTTLESKCSEYEKSFVVLREDLEEQQQTHQTETTEMKDILDGYENNRRRKNLRLLGFPLGVEGDNAVEFLEKYLPEILGLTEPVEIEEVRRMRQSQKNYSGDQDQEVPRPRALVATLLRYRDVMRILEASRRKKEIFYGNSKIMIFPDLSPAIHEKRMAFAPLKKLLREAGIRYGIMHPATFRVDLRSGGSKSFSSAEAARSFLRREYPDVIS